jgi:hypothetical protein
MIQKLSHWEFTKLFCKLTNKWCVYISCPDIEEEWTKSEWNEVLKAAPCLSKDEDFQILIDNEGWIVCDTKEEAYSIFEQIVGDDGPTRVNSYDGNMGVYACIYNSQGVYMENT